MYNPNKYDLLSINVKLNVVKPEPENIFGDVVYSYTRQEAIDDGFLVALDNLGGEVIKLSKEHYKYPIALTRSVYDIVEKAVNNKNWLNCLTGVLHDILHMSKAHLVRCKDGLLYLDKSTIKDNQDTVIFPVIITGAGRKRNYVFKLMVHGGDNGEPVITISLPHED